MGELKEYLKSSKNIVEIYDGIKRKWYSLITIFSPVLNTKLRYKSVYGRKLNLNNPETLVEKLLWLKLYNYNSNPLVIKCADKVAVREYVTECGYGNLLNDIYGVYSNPKDIPWDELPEKFVIKWNFGAGYNYICKSKSTENHKEVLSKLKKWGKIKYWLPHSEMQYKYIPKKLLCEHYLEDKDMPGVIPDYKVYCFNGVARAILVMHDRGSQMKTEFFDTNWNSLKNTDKYSKVKKSTLKPKCLQEMLQASEKLSKPFPFVRCDFYIVNNKLYFGEMTFTPAGGLYVSQTDIDGKSMAEFLNIK